MQDLTPLCAYGVIKSGKPFDANFGHSALAIQDGI